MSLSASTAQVYNSNSIQYGSKIETVKRGATSGAATTVGQYIFDNISINRPTKLIDKTDEISGDNGFVLVAQREDGSGVVQMGPAADKWPHRGDWFEDTLDSDIGVERFVISSVSTPFEKDGYYKCNVNLVKDKFRA